MFALGERVLAPIRPRQALSDVSRRFQGLFVYILIRKYLAEVWSANWRSVGGEKTLPGEQQLILTYVYQLFHFEDRKGSKFLLSPTHEEEITSIVANDIHSHRDLPLRLYQISRRDFSSL